MRGEGSERLALQRTLYESRNPTRRWLHRRRRDWVRGEIAATRRVRRALEVGPGSGVYLRDLAARADQVVAADIDDAMLDNAREMADALPNLQCVRDDICCTSLEAGSFELVLCSEVLEHLPDPTAALRSLRRLLAPGGSLILTTPQRYSTPELCLRVAFLPGVRWLVRRVYREPVLPPGHCSLMTAGELQRRCAAAGLAVVASARLGFYLPLLAEFGGHAGQRLLARGERALRSGPGAFLLWTQCYRLRAAPADAAAPVDFPPRP